MKFLGVERGKQRKDELLDINLGHDALDRMLKTTSGASKGKQMETA